MVFGLTNLKTRSFEERRLTPDGESNPDHGAVSTFCERGEGEFLGGPIGEDEAGLEAVFGRGVATRARRLFAGGRVRAGGGAGVSQRVLRAELCDDLRDAGSAHRADAQAELSAAGPEAVSAAGGSAIMRRSRREPRRSIAPATGVKLNRRFAAFALAGGESTRRW